MRARKGAARLQAKKRLFKAVKGYRGGRRRLLRTVKVAILRSGQYAYRDRKVRKRMMRRLWILRINAACRQRGCRYSEFMHALKESGIDLNRKVLAQLAIIDPAAFDKIVETAGVGQLAAASA
ncbi:50S ribosomal protein L20 [Planctomycetes bacterium Pan216]|uniref:50S ribosomal protein L20 n=1 Tax=Kolteria novifilia TaxID=2527975 RepID=UPI0011A47095